MIKTVEILDCQPYFLVCRFNNGEVKKLNCETIFKEEANKKYAQKILNTVVFSKVKIGELGQVYWEHAAEMKDEQGNSFTCEYDLSPEFVYHHSIAVK
jgi:hypothetical protein